MTSGASGFVTTNATDRAGCVGDPTAVLAAANGAQPTTIGLPGLTGQETALTVANNGLTSLQLTLGGHVYRLAVTGGQPGGWQDGVYAIAANGVTVVPLPGDALGATSGSLTVPAQAGGLATVSLQ